MAKGFKHGGGGGSDLNFRVLSGTATPSSPKENDIWVNTDAEITGWHFGADEPNVYNMATHTEDSHQLISPHKLSDGDVLNFVIPKTCTSLDWVRIVDIYNGDKIYAIRNSDSSPVFAWPAGTKISVCVSNIKCTMGDITDVPVAYLKSWGSYYHEEGTVWITTDNSSPVGFNALKKNGLMVCPLKASQYIDGAWVEKTAKSYQGGAWVDWWNGQLYEHGNEYESITGGYSTYGSGSTLAKNADHLLIISQGNSGVYTNNPVDMTKYKTLTIDWTCMRGGIDTQFQVRSEKSSGTSGWAVGTKIVGPTAIRQTTTLDISSLSGSYYIGIGRFSSGGPNESKIHSIIMS